MFPPLTTAAAFSPRAFTRPAHAGRDARRPGGLGTIFILSSMKKMALAISASLDEDHVVDVLPDQLVGELARVLHRYTIGDGLLGLVRDELGRLEGHVHARERLGLDPHHLDRGLMLLAATAIPDISPPPPIATAIVWSSGAASIISRPAVPCPATTMGSSKAWTNVAFSLRAISFPISRASSNVAPWSTTLAP